MNSTHHKPGDVIADRYEVIAYVGAGGMQQVYCATDLAFNRQVALKAPKIESAHKRFSRSARVSAKVNHPNVAKTLDYIPTAARDYLIEEFIVGQDFQARLNADFHFLDPHLAAHVLHHVAKGVAAVHHVAVFHRDLKPSNIMVSNDPGLQVVKVTDFGIAKMAQSEIEDAIMAGEESITGSQTVVGALPYMAPEMFQDPKNASTQADVWALGAILYHALTGQRPFGTGLQAIPKIITRAFPPKAKVLQPPAQFETLLDDLWGVMESCLQLDPASRPTADELVERLSQICYSTAQRRVGRIRNYKFGRGDWGFIIQPDGSEFFFHRNSYYAGSPEPGSPVNFACFPGDPRPRAFPVLPIKEAQQPSPSNPS